MIAGFTAGPMVERIGPRSALIGALAGYLVFGTLPVMTSQIIVLLGSRLLLGVACGTLTTAATVLLVAAHEGASRSRMLGFQTAVGSALGVVALMAAGALVVRFGWHSVFVIYGVCVLPLLAIALLRLPDSRAVGDPGAAALLPTIATLWPVYVVAGLLFVIPVACAGQSAFLLNEIGMQDPFVQSILMAIGSLGCTITGMLFGRLYGATGARAFFALSLGVGAVGLIMIGCARSVALFGLGLLLNGAAVGLYLSYLWLVVAQLAPPAMRPRGIALLSTAMYLGGFLYPLIFGLLALPFGATGGFVVMGAIMIAGAGTALVLRRARLLLC
jgi:MFS family permease